MRSRWPRRFRQLCVSFAGTHQRPRHADSHQAFLACRLSCRGLSPRRARHTSGRGSIALELRERPKSMKHQFAARRGRIDGFGDVLKSDSLGLQLAHQLDQLLERPPQPVEPPDREHVARSERIATRSSPGLCTLPPLTVSSIIFSHPTRFGRQAASQDSAPLSKPSQPIIIPHRLAARVKKPVEISGGGLLRSSRQITGVIKDHFQPGLRHRTHQNAHVGVPDNARRQIGRPSGCASLETSRVTDFRHADSSKFAAASGEVFVQLPLSPQQD